MGVFYMFLSESDYDSLCTFPLQLSWGPHSQFFLLADYLLRHIVTAFALFFICRLSLLYTCDCICNFSHLQIISCAIFVTTFALFFICRLSSTLYLWPHSQFFLLADYLLRHTCDRISFFSHLQIISCAILVTAFTIILICRLSPLYTCDCIRTFSHL